MAAMILAKKVIFNISRSFPQTQSLFLRSSSSSTHKFSRATLFTASAKEKLAETGELTTMMSQKVKHKAAELKDIGRRSVANKAKQGSYKSRESSAQNVAGKTKDMAGKTDQEASKEKEKHWKKPPEGWHVLSTDGSSRKDISGIGSLIRDQNGSIVVAFAAGIPSTAPIPVIEIKAILEGVRIAINIGVTKLIIHSDSMQAVEVINGRLKAPTEARDDIILLNSMKIFRSFGIVLGISINEAIKLMDDGNNSVTAREFISRADGVMMRDNNLGDGMVQINVDGGCRNGMGVAAMVIRDAEGRFVRGKSSIEPSACVAYMEALAIRMALLEAKHMGIQSIQLMSDALGIVQAIQDGNMNFPWQARRTVQDVIRLQEDFDICSIKFIRREHNGIADALVHDTFNCNMPQEWATCPECIRSFVN